MMVLLRFIVSSYHSSIDYRKTEFDALLYIQRKKMEREEEEEKNDMYMYIDEIVNDYSR